MKEAAKTWGDESEYYLKAAVRFADEFEHWGGFGPLESDELQALQKHGKLYPPS